MQKKPKAVEVMPDKMWITYDSENEKSGTLTKRDTHYIWLKSSGDRETIIDIVDHFEVEGRQVSTWHQVTVLGYPAGSAEVFNIEEQQNLPTYTKTKASKVRHAAGYYAVHFTNNGWTESFCPKIVTLEKYEWTGPFRTESDMNLALARKRQGR